MAVNSLFKTSGTTNTTEKNLYSDLVKESIQIYGHDVNYIDRTLEIVNFGDKSVKYIGRNASSSTATGNFNKHVAQQKEILEKVLKD